jgi:hypothetical protein
LWQRRGCQRPKRARHPKADAAFVRCCADRAREESRESGNERHHRSARWALDFPNGRHGTPPMPDHALIVMVPYMKLLLKNVVNRSGGGES